MKANSKRRALVSSLSMLLVAAVSLGAATYAWFTSNTTATASGINVKTIQASELVISKSDKNWDTTINYGVANKILIPASTTTGTSWFTANAEVKTNFAKPTADDFASASGDTYYFANQLNVKNQGEATVKDVTISFSGLTNEYARVAVVPANESGTNTGTFTDCIYDVSGDTYDAVSSATTTTSVKAKNNYTISVGSLAKNEAKYYNIYVWFEGQDAQCIDSNAGQAIDDIEFTVTGTTEDQV